LPGYIEDRWIKKRPNPATGERERTALYGKGKRYKVAGIPGVRDRSFERLADAKTWLSDAQSKSRAGAFTDPRRGDMPLREYVENHWWPTLRGDPSTLLNIRTRVWTHILPRLGAYPLNTIKVEQLRRWLKDVEADIGPSTINGVWGYLSTILTSAVEDERIPRNYCKSSSVKPPTIPPRPARAWQRDRVAAVREALPPRFRVMVDLGVGAGLRQGEVFGLAVEDIDEAANVLHVQRQIKMVGTQLVFALPKGGKTRDVPLPGSVARRLKEHLEEFPAQKITLPWGDPTPPETEKQAKERAPRTYELIVTSPWKRAIRRNSWNHRHWKPALVGAGVISPPLERKQPVKGKYNRHRTVKTYAESREDGFHALRHTAASVWLDAREPIVAVSKWLGHEDPSITLRVYAHMMPEADGRGRAAMDAWFASAF
jgi:integrase